MASAALVSTITQYYNSVPKKWTESMVHDAVEKGTLTAAEFKTITGNDYVANSRPSLDGGALGNNSLNWTNPA